MKLGENGVAFFVEETEKGEKVPFYLATSQIPTSSSSSAREEMYVDARAFDSGPILASNV